MTLSARHSNDVGVSPSAMIANAAQLQYSKSHQQLPVNHMCHPAGRPCALAAFGTPIPGKRIPNRVAYAAAVLL